VAGWISNRALDVPMSMGEKQGAAVLDNFFPTTTTAILRRGKERYVTLAGDVTSLFTYVNGANRKIFAATETAISNITIQASVSTVFSSTGGDWSVEQFATTGGVFLVGVNGESTGFIYDGAQFYPYVPGGVSIISYTSLTAAFTVGATVSIASPAASAKIYEVIPSGTPGQGALLLTNVVGDFHAGHIMTDTSGGSATSSSVDTIVAPGISFPGSLTTADMSFVWAYKNRLWFLQKDSLNAWYMDNVDSIGGAPEVYPMGGILQKGGSLLWGAAWALESGASGGLSDQLVITSDQGEAAIFQGTYPEDTASWVPVGAYRLGTPMGKRAFFRGGGDIAIATSVGLVPLSKAISLDVTALAQAAVSYNIQDAWQEAVEGRGLTNWQCTIWPESKMAVISPPTTIGTYDPVLFISNTETGAWCRYTNWDARALTVFNGGLYFGGKDGFVYKANISGLDDGDTYTGVYVPLFDDLGMPANRKVAKMGRAVTRAANTLTYSLQCRFDFDTDLGAPPAAVMISGASVWGVGVWGEAVWGGGTDAILQQDWKSVGRSGYAASMAYQVTSGAFTPLDVEIIRLEMTWTAGEMVS
jgi:hypothetical protein